MSKPKPPDETNKLQVVSIGGCVMHSIAERLDTSFYNHKHHLWRRPTIALMSDPVDVYRFKTSIIPNRYSTYFINDVTGGHLNELKTIKYETLIIMDITRDIFTGVVEVEPNKYALNPIDGVGILDDITPENMNDNVLSEILRKDKYKTLHPIRDEEEYFKLWCKSISNLADFLIENFRTVIVPEVYFSENSVELHDGHSIDRARSLKVNPLLSRMYEYVRTKTPLKTISIPKDRILTGSDVPWGGPFATHVIEETYALYCQKVDEIVRRDEVPAGFYIEEAAFKRAELHAQEQKAKLRAEKKTIAHQDEIAHLKQSLKEANDNLVTLQDENAAIKDEMSDLSSRIAEKKKIIAGLKSANSELAQKTAELAHLNADIYSRIHKLKVELRQPLYFHVKKRVARATRTMRSR